LFNICLQFEITDTEIDRLHTGFVAWVQEYEEYIVTSFFLQPLSQVLNLLLFFCSIYYQYNPSCISACPFIIHALLHITDSIEAMGPVWRYWAFPMEHYCGLLQPAIRSCCFPYALIDKFVIENAQVPQIKVVYNKSKELTLCPP
jgi:hypothetical protein